MAVIAAFIPYYWLPIRARSPAPSPDTTAAVTRDAVEELGLSPGVPATAAVKATSVMVERGVV